MIDFRSVLLFSGMTCALLALYAVVQAKIFPQFRETMELLSYSMVVGCISLIGAALTYNDPSIARTFAANIPGGLAYWFGGLCAMHLYEFQPRRKIMFTALGLAVPGFLILQQGLYMDIWTTLVQMSFAAIGLFAVLRGREPDAPLGRFVLMGCLIPLIVASLLHVYVQFQFAVEHGSQAWNGNYESESGIVLLWAFAPFTFSIAVATIVNARIAGRLKHLADYDALTGLKVRRRFFEESRSIVERRNESAGELAVMMIDIDHFKSINDRFGHAAGDSALQHCAALISSTTRPDTLVSRYGGEEFCVLARIDRREEGHAIAERIRATIAAEPMRINGEMVRLSVSIGIAFHDANTTIESLLDKADRHLYAAKRGGRNRVMGFDIGPEMAPVV